uniref:Nucleophosmin n=1 Tax=Otolemur garnettii TaxID=30611 RepID=H0XVG1_OTOGA
VEDSRDVDMDMSPLNQNCLFGCELKADEDYHFKVDNDANHQLSLRTVSLGADAKDYRTMNYDDGSIKATLATLKMSVQLTFSLGGFEIPPPMVLRLKCGLGTVHISGQHLVAMEKDAESEDEGEKDVKLLGTSGKQSAPGGGSKVPPKKVKLAAEEEEEGEEEEDFDEEETEEKTPIKRSRILKKKQKKAPKTPKGPSSIEDSKPKIIEKGGSLPKVEAKFINFVKNCFGITDQEAIQDLWQWRKCL